MKARPLLAALAGSVLLSGCLMGLGQPAQVAPPQRFVATGHGAIASTGFQLNNAQQRLMAQRAARVDAYRALAEQIYGLRVSGNTTVSAFATQNDTVRAYVDSHLRGARLVEMTQLPDGNYEATVELELPGRFTDCISGRQQACVAPTAVSAPAARECIAGGCVQPSNQYYSPQQ